MYDYGARFYMPDIGKFGTHDPLSEITLQPYAYANNNPIFYNDPTGMLAEEASFDKGIGGESGGAGLGGLGNNTLAICPTCPNTPQFQPYIDDPNNTYVYDSQTNTAEKETQIEEVIVNAPAKSNSNPSADSNSNSINTALGAIGFANELKVQALDYQVRSNYKSARTAKEFEKLRDTQKKWRTKNTLGKGGAKYLSVVKGLGTAIGAVGAIDAWRQQIENPSPGNFLRASVNTATLFMRMNPAVAIGLGIMDVTGASDYIYGGIDQALGD